MSPVERRLYRLSPNQLRALLELAKTKEGIIVATQTASHLKKKGKALGGIFSSLSRQVINGEHLVTPWGRSADGYGLRWKLNTKLISKDRVLQITKELLEIY